MNEIKQLRMNIMGGMNAYVLELDDENLLDYWANYLPDEITEENLAKWAEDDETWIMIVQVFGKIVRCD